MLTKNCPSYPPPLPIKNFQLRHFLTGALVDWDKSCPADVHCPRLILYLKVQFCFSVRGCELAAEVWVSEGHGGPRVALLVRQHCSRDQGKVVAIQLACLDPLRRSVICSWTSHGCSCFSHNAIGSSTDFIFESETLKVVEVVVLGNYSCCRIFFAWFCCRFVSLLLAMRCTHSSDL